MTTQASINKRMAPFIKAMKEESIFRPDRKEGQRPPYAVGEG